jgi:ribosome-binding factor A
MSRRTDRINGVLRQEISLMLSRELSDPRLSGVVSITRVDTTTDLNRARVYVSVLGDQAHKQTVLKGISSASGFIRRELKGRLYLRHVPDLDFVLDESLEDAGHIFNLMDNLLLEAQSNESDSPANAQP